MRNSKYIKFTYTPNKSKISGFYDTEDGNIYINSRLGKILTELVYIHECKHKECSKRKCKCSEKLYWCEYHAFRAELDFLIEKDSYIHWKIYFKNVISELKKYSDFNISGWKQHFMALSKVCRLKRFKEYARYYNCLNEINSIMGVYYGSRG